MASAPGGPNTRLHKVYTMRQRNVASLIVSDDLWNWRIVQPVMTDTSGLTPEDSIRLTGFQYTDFYFDGDDIVFVVRVAQRGSNNFHDANEIVYAVLKDFRKLV